MIKAGISIAKNLGNKITKYYKKSSKRSLAADAFGATSVAALGYGGYKMVKTKTPEVAVFTSSHITKGTKGELGFVPSMAKLYSPKYKSQKQGARDYMISQRKKGKSIRVLDKKTFDFYNV